MTTRHPEREVTAPLRWVLIGASDIAATRVLPAMRALGQAPLAILSSDPVRAAVYAQANGIPRVVTSLEQALDVEADAVYVSTTNEQHHRSATAAADAGRHVLCEKPVATTHVDGADILQAAERNGIVLATHHHLRASPVIRAVRDVVRSGEIGSLLAVRVNHAVQLPQRLQGWRLDRPGAGAGVVLDITVHDIDTLRFITGLNVIEVMGTGVNQGLAAPGVCDAVMVVLTLENAVLASAHDAFTVPLAGTALEVHGTAGSIFVSDAMTQDPDGEVIVRRADGSRTIDVGPRTDLYETGLTAFARAVDGTGEVLATGRDGFASMATALAVEESIRTGQRIVVAATPPRSETGADPR